MGKRKMKWPLFITCGVILALGIALLLCWLIRPQLVLKENAVIEAGTPFSPELLIEEVKNGKLEDVSVESTVDTNLAGKYEVILKIGIDTYTAPFTVEDTVAPLFTLHTPGITVFSDQMATADDLLAMIEAEVADVQEVTLILENLPPDLTKPGVYELTVIAADRSNNRTSLPLQLIIEEPDVTAPVIKGAANTSFTVGTAFDPMKGVWAEDDKDEKPTVTLVSSNVDINKVGSYTVVYEAKDASGNTAAHTRSVAVMAKPYIYTSAGGATWNAAGRSNQPYLVAVNRAQCTVTVYGKDDNGNYTVPVKAIVCSVGRSGHATPTMEVHSLDRYRWCLMVDGTWGQYAIRVRGGIMFHSVPYYSQDAGDLEYDEFNKLGSPASLGCIRMTVKDVKWLYDNCPYGFTTVIYDDTTSPGPLGKPSAPKIDTSNEELRGWDPTDPNKNNPWKN